MKILISSLFILVSSLAWAAPTSQYLDLNLSGTVTSSCTFVINRTTSGGTQSSPPSTFYTLLMAANYEVLPQITITCNDPSGSSLNTGTKKIKSQQAKRFDQKKRQPDFGASLVSG